MGSQQKLLFSSSKGVLGIGGGAPLFFPIVWSGRGGKLIFHEWVEADLIADVYELDPATDKRERVARSELQVVNWN
jgi:hypothetical protein